jgi:hypothetical protein
MPEPAAERSQRLVNELRVSGHLMTLDTGLFCIVCNPSKAADGRTGLPGVRVSLPPGPASRPEAVSISTFRQDGWMTPFGDAALVRVTGGPAQILVTVYQAQNVPEGGAPNLQVLRLTDAVPSQASTQVRPAADAAVPAVPSQPKVMDLVAHIQGVGDVGAMLGDWLGEKGSNRWIEGFAVAPTSHVGPADIEYQAVLGRDWLSPWVEGGQFCGSRGMSLPLLGLRLRLKGEAAKNFTCSYQATFVDGGSIGPVAAGEACQVESLAALESLKISIAPIGEASSPASEAAPTGRKPATRKPAARRA